MHYRVGITDRDWLETLRRLQPDEVNFVTVDPDLRFVVSPRLHEEFENGRVYYDFDGRSLANVPERLTDQPGHEFLEWHNSEVYLG